MNAEIIAVGSELLTPFRIDTNSLFLTRELNKLGVDVIRKAVVGDDRKELRRVFEHALDVAELVICSGGLGPTEDDLTREAIAETLGRRLVRDDEILRTIQERFRRYGRAMPENNVRQSMILEGAQALKNPRGTAPGQWIEAKGRVVVLLPGPPNELEAMFANEVRPRLDKLGHGRRLYVRDLRVTGLPESEVEHRVSSIYRQYAECTVTILAAPGEIQLHPRVWSEDAAAANRTLDEMVKGFGLALGENLFSTSGESMEEVVARELQQHQATIATAESCTGGMVAARLTNVAGSSAYFLGGVVCYSNDLKSAWTGVPPEVIESKGAVSAEVAVALAEGIRRNTRATVGVSITGIAGPSGGTPEKPVGLVHIALADERGTKERAFQFPGDRDRIRTFATISALDMVRRHFLYATLSKG
ncbi:MAG: competence/damage-inducible protein A [Candidatus Acidiferrales bacterium]|jgi:nicotinamide-nucleotide amidase